VFKSNKLAQVDLLFESKQEHTQGWAPCLTYQQWTNPEKIFMDKHSSLFCNHVRNKEKKVLLNFDQIGADWKVKQVPMILELFSRR
jgi:hypothetical protein